MVKTSYLTNGAILTSLTVILFLLSRIFTTADLTLLTLSSVIICISIIKFGKRSSMLVLISSIITSIISGVIEYSIIYLIFFGTYPLIKFNIEQINNILLEFILKIIYFNLLFILVLYTYLKFFLPININFNILIIVCVFGSLLFLMYDIFLTQIIRYIYLNKFIKKL